MISLYKKTKLETVSLVTDQAVNESRFVVTMRKIENAVLPCIEFLVVGIIVLLLVRKIMIKRRRKKRRQQRYRRK